MVIDDDVYHGLTALRIADLVTSRQVSARAVVDACLRRLEHVDNQLRAFRRVWPQWAHQAADAVDRSVAKGEKFPLAGVPIGVKAWGGLAAPQARRLLAAGCVAVGETAVPRSRDGWQTWGHTDRGPTVNPWRPDRVPGGSSAGSAVAVAAGVVPLATGSDGAGSTRIPAAWCGVVGVKPTNARRPGQDAAGLSVGGPLARSVPDAAAYLDAVLGSDLATAVAATAEPTRAAWTATLGFATTDPNVASVARAAAERLAGAGILTWTDTQVELLDPEAAWHSLRTGHGDAQTIRAENDSRLAHVFTTVDLLMTPTTPTRAHGHEGPGSLMNVSLTWVFNISGHPAVSVPAGFTDDGTPVGLQLVARHDDEARLIRVAAAFERLAPWPAPALANRLRCAG